MNKVHVYQTSKDLSSMNKVQSATLMSHHVAHRSSGVGGRREGKGEKVRGESAVSSSTPPAGSNLKGTRGLAARELWRETRGCVKERVWRNF